MKSDLMWNELLGKEMTNVNEVDARQDHRNIGRVINDIAQIVITILISNLLIISIPQDL